MAENYYFVMANPNFNGASTTWLYRTTDVSPTLYNIMKQNNRKSWNNLPQKEMFEIEKKSIDLDDNDFDRSKYNIVEIFMFNIDYKM